MFRETKCGCIFSPTVGTVRMCELHRGTHLTERVDPPHKSRVVRTYPSFGRGPAAWSGK